MNSLEVKWNRFLISIWKYYTLVSSSACRATSTDIPDLLSPLLPIVHRFWQVRRVTSRIFTELLFVGSSWSPCFCLTMWGGLWENTTYQLATVYFVTHIFFVWFPVAFVIYEAFFFRCGTRPYEWETQWDSNSLVKTWKSSSINQSHLLLTLPLPFKINKQVINQIS